MRKIFLMMDFRTYDIMSGADVNFVGVSRYIDAIECEKQIIIIMVSRFSCFSINSLGVNDSSVALFLFVILVSKLTA